MKRHLALLQHGVQGREVRREHVAGGPLLLNSHRQKFLLRLQRRQLHRGHRVFNWGVEKVVGFRMQSHVPTPRASPGTPAPPPGQPAAQGVQGSSERTAAAHATTLPSTMRCANTCTCARRAFLEDLNFLIQRGCPTCTNSCEHVLCTPQGLWYAEAGNAARGCLRLDAEGPPPNCRGVSRRQRARSPPALP